MTGWYLAFGLLAFIFATRWARHLIVRWWLVDRITNRQAALLFAGVTLLPYLLLAAFAIARDPTGLPLFALMFLLIGAPAYALVAAAMHYAAAHKVKEHMRRQRGLEENGPK